MRFLTALMIAVAVLFVGCREHATTPAEIDPPQQVATPAEEPESILPKEFVFQQILREVNQEMQWIYRKPDFDISNPETYPFHLKLARQPLPRVEAPSGPFSQVDFYGHRFTFPLENMEVVGRAFYSMRWESGERSLMFLWGNKDILRSELEMPEHFSELDLPEDIADQVQQFKATIREDFEKALSDFSDKSILDNYVRIIESTHEDFGPGKALGERIFGLTLASLQHIFFLYGDWENPALYENDATAIIVASPEEYDTQIPAEDGTFRETTRFDFSGFLIDKRTDSDWVFVGSARSMESAKEFYHELLGILPHVVVEKVGEDALPAEE